MAEPIMLVRIPYNRTRFRVFVYADALDSNNHFLKIFEHASKDDTGKSFAVGDVGQKCMHADPDVGMYVGSATMEGNAMVRCTAPIPYDAMALIERYVRDQMRKLSAMKKTG